MEEESIQQSYVKGSMILNYVKIIRANKDRDWDKYLEPDDWEIIKSQVFATNRYPYECFRRIGYAVFKEIANSNLEVARTFGRFNMKTFLDIYSNSFLEAGDPVRSIRKFVMSKQVFISGSSANKLLDHGQNWARCQVIIPSEENHKERELAFCYQYAGSIEELVEQAGGKRAKATVEKKDYHSYEVLVKWD